MYALPGNHDWYDGLSSFLRLFARTARTTSAAGAAGRPAATSPSSCRNAGGCSRSTRSSARTSTHPQLDYFHTVAAQIAPGDRIILCTPTPSWVEASWDPGAYDSIDYFVRTVLNPTKADVKLMLSGDLHHYARYERTETGS